MQQAKTFSSGNTRWSNLCVWVIQGGGDLGCVGVVCGGGGGGGGGERWRRLWSKVHWPDGLACRGLFLTLITFPLE